MRPKIKILLIDSGVDLSHPALDSLKCSGINLINMSRDLDDKLGHGTAICAILNKVQNCEIFLIKIFDKMMYCEEDLFLSALNYIIDNFYTIKPDIIHLSAGLTMPTQIQELRKLTQKIVDLGCLFISAFDNLGSMTYPAIFDHVVGVDMSLKCINSSEYEYLPESYINFRAYGRNQRLPWLKHSYENVAGASFAAPHITVKAANIISKTDVHEPQYIIKQLAKEAAYVVPCPPKSTERNKPFPIKHAIVVPFNKEIHSLISFEDLLEFKIDGIFDDRHLGHTGKDVSKFIPVSQYKEKKVIRDFQNIDWNGPFDTVILGHNRELSQFIHIDLNRYILEKCIHYKKNLFAFPDLSDYNSYLKKMKEAGLNYYYPSFQKENLPPLNLKKLYSIGTPILCVCGTGSKQGKFTTQLTLRRKFLEAGYKVGQLSTEPSGLLFGMDDVFTNGFECDLDVKGEDSIRAINFLLAEINEKGPDIIIVGTQGMTVAEPPSSNLLRLPIHQNEVLFAVQPDAYVLCVSIEDPIPYIHRTIRYLESMFDSKVLALVLFPLDHVDKWSIFGNRRRKVDEKSLRLKINELEDEFKIPTLLLGEGEKDLLSLCINYFSQDDELEE